MVYEKTRLGFKATLLSSGNDYHWFLEPNEPCTFFYDAKIWQSLIFLPVLSCFGHQNSLQKISIRGLKNLLSTPIKVLSLA